MVQRMMALLNQTTDQSREMLYALLHSCGSPGSHKGSDTRPQWPGPERFDCQLHTEVKRIYFAPKHGALGIKPESSHEKNPVAQMRFPQWQMVICLPADLEKLPWHWLSFQHLLECRFPLVFFCKLYTHPPEFYIDQWKKLLLSHKRKCVPAKSLQSCPILCDPMYCNPPDSSVHGILQARILESVAGPSSRESSPPRNRTCVFYVSCIGRQVLYH